MLEMLEPEFEEISFVQCPWCESGVYIEGKNNVYDVEDDREQVPFCCEWCLESYIEKNEDIYQLIRLRKI